LIRRFIVGFLAVIGAIVILFAGGIAFLIARAVSPPLPDKIILTVDLRQGLAEGPGESSLRRLLVSEKPTMRDFLDAITRADRDPRVKGLVAFLGGSALGLADCQQVRDAIARFRAKGKFATAFSDSFGELGAGTSGYYLATAFDRIWLQPMGNVGLTGLYDQVPFFKGTFGLLGITPEFDHRGQYKTAMNSLTHSKMTPAHREETEALIRSTADEIVDGIAKGRRLDPEAVRQLIDAGPYLAQAALAKKLVDHLGYRDEALARARALAGAGSKTVRLSTYLDRAGRPYTRGARIAVIYASGLIVRGGGGHNPLFRSEEMAADTVARALRRAARDKEVRAILFRIDSPGGSVVASETIWRAVEKARARGKPVIVSMGDLAGSGGYYIAVGADKIVAEPATLTASIGVFAGKFVVSGLLKKLGITTDSAQFGANAGMFSSTADFSPVQQQKFNAFLDAVYQGFKERVAKGRHMSMDAVETVAQGRVWTGAQAKVRGLVDALGGFDTALELAKEAAHIAPDAPVHLVVYPRKKGLFELFYDTVAGKGNDSGPVASRAAGELWPLLQQVQLLLANPGVLTMPIVGVGR
jgi:protease IV